MTLAACVAACAAVYGLTAVAHGTATVLAILAAVCGVFWLVWNDLAAIDPDPERHGSDALPPTKGTDRSEC